MTVRALLVLATLLAGCSGQEWYADDPERVIPWAGLTPVANPNEAAAAQPTRQHPYGVAVTPDGSRAVVTLRGSEVDPGTEVVVVDVPAARVLARLEVGPRPSAVGMHPGGRFAVVLSHLSPSAAIIDVVAARVTGTLDVGYYAEDLAFSADGGSLFVSSRARDSVDSFGLRERDGTLHGNRRSSAPAGASPGAVALSPDGRKLYVADLGLLGVRVFRPDPLEEIGSIDLSAPVFDLAPMGAFVVATTLGAERGLPCVSDADYPGEEGDGIFEHITDGTCGRGFSDIQNEIAFIDPEHDFVAARYTSDTAEVSEADREGDHDPERMRVVGSLPHSLAVVDATRAYVTMGASFEVVELVVDEVAPPAMPPIEMPRSWPTGLAPRGVGVDAGGRTLVVADMLGDTISILGVDDGRRVVVELGGGAPSFPATSAEIGELFFYSARYSTDGDQSCSHCHPDGESDGKAWGVGLVRAFGRRATMVVRNLHQTQPLLIEGVFDENDFRVEMEAMAFRPDFHDSSYALQVRRRDEFFTDASRELTGLDIGFEQMVRHVGDFLVAEPRLLPSPFPRDDAEVERGRALFERPDVGCAGCHPAPTFASPDNFVGIVTPGRFDRPRRDLDPDISTKYIETARDGFFNANSLRGAWDRRGAFLHDGRARSLRETILTPGHECLRAGERGFNEHRGQVDTHGGVSHLGCEQIDDLVRFLETID